MATLYRANGKKSVIKPKGKHFTIGELQDAVGGNIQLIDLHDHYLVVNANGHLLDLHYNSEATRLVYQFGYDYVAGDAVYCEKTQI